MQDNIDLHVLQMNYLEFLTQYLEGYATLEQVFKLNEKIYNRNHNNLSQSLIRATTPIHNLKERIENKEKVDKDTIKNTINDVVIGIIEDDKLNY